MCAYCNSIPCVPRCPNASDPEVIYKCVQCKADIVEGDMYYNIEGEAYCEECISGCHKEAQFKE